MAIQLPNPGLGDGQTGDNEFVMWTKVKDNFNDPNHAASRLVGTTTWAIPLAQDIFKAAYGRIDSVAVTFTPEQTDALENGTRVVVPRSAIDSTLSGADLHFLIETKALNNSHLRGYQEAIGITVGERLIRTCDTTRVWGEWQSISTQKAIYNTTTATGANVAVEASGRLMRSTSSERYKDILAPLELDDARYDDAMALKPIVYRSTANADNPAYHYYSFSAEELGAYDPAFTLWRETETVTDEDGNTTEQPLAERQAEGININALLAMSHAIAIKQGELIKDLQEQVDALKAKLEV